jgi:hypothetical protein
MPDEPLFRSVDAALRFAYRVEGSAIVKVSSLFRQMRGSTVRGRRLTDGPWDDHGQAAMILALTDRILAPQKMVCVRGYYTQPNDQALETRKQTDYRILAEIVRETVPAPHWYVVDVIREWSGDRRQHADGWWAEQLRIHVKQLSRYRFGRRERDSQGILSVMDKLYLSALSDLYGPMEESGLVGERS